jgi:hypothetical protein
MKDTTETGSGFGAAQLNNREVKMEDSRGDLLRTNAL